MLRVVKEGFITWENHSADGCSRRDGSLAVTPSVFKTVFLSSLPLHFALLLTSNPTYREQKLKIFKGR